MTSSHGHHLTKAWALLVLGLMLIPTTFLGCSGVKYGLTRHDPEFVVTDVQQIFDRMEQEYEPEFTTLDDGYRTLLRTACNDEQRMRIHERWDEAKFVRLQELALLEIQAVEAVLLDMAANEGANDGGTPPIGHATVPVERPESRPGGMPEGLPPIPSSGDTPPAGVQPVPSDQPPGLPPLPGGGEQPPTEPQPPPPEMVPEPAENGGVDFEKVKARVRKQLWPYWPDNLRDLAELKQAVLDYDCIQCANREIETRNDAYDRRLTGLRFYQPSPYLLVYSDGKGGINWEIHHLPDPTKKMSAKPYNFLASLQYKLTIDEELQVMTKATEVADSTAVPKAILTAVKELAPGIMGALLNEAAEAQRLNLIPTPHLYKIVTDDRGTRLIGGQGDVRAIRYVELDPKRKSGGNVWLPGGAEPDAGGD